MGRFIDRSRCIRWGDTLFPTAPRASTIYHPRNAVHYPRLARLMQCVHRFRAELNRLRNGGGTHCQASLLRQSPLLSRAVQEPAAEFVRRQGLDRFEVTTAAHELHARNAVVAVPDRNARQLATNLAELATEKFVGIPMTTLHVRGTRPPDSGAGKVVFRPPSEPVTALLPVGQNVDSLFARTENSETRRWRP